MSFSRTQQLRDLQLIVSEISREIMWVNDREEAELVFDWGDKNIDQYIPKKQESYSVSGWWQIGLINSYRNLCFHFRILMVSIWSINILANTFL